MLPLIIRLFTQSRRTYWAAEMISMRGWDRREAFGLVRRAQRVVRQGQPRRGWIFHNPSLSERSERRLGTVDGWSWTYCQPRRGWMHLRCVARRRPVVTRFAHCASEARPQPVLLSSTPPVCTRFARLDWGYEAFSLRGWQGVTRTPRLRRYRGWGDCVRTVLVHLCELPLKTEGLSAFSNSQRQ